MESGICAGYSLLYKEMMDRQGIQCDYVRGIAVAGTAKEKHAWNVLTIDGIKFPVDLTWDSGRMHSGYQELSFFGNDPEFLKEHMADRDESVYGLSILSDKQVDTINIDNTQIRDELDESDKINVLKLVIEETYKKYASLYDNEEAGWVQITSAIKAFIQEGKLNLFTRQGNARDSIERYFTREDMLELLVDDYVMDCRNKQGESSNILTNALKQNIIGYGEEQAKMALTEYISYGYTGCFTRRNNARGNIEEHMTSDTALDMIIEDYVSRELEAIKNAEEFEKQNNETMIQMYSENNEYTPGEKKYFYANELAQIDLPIEKKENLIQKAIHWIKERSSKFYDKVKNSTNQKEKMQEDDKQR